MVPPAPRLTVHSLHFSPLPWGGVSGWRGVAGCFPERKKLDLSWPSQNFTTENTEDHEGTQRFFGLRMGAHRHRVTGGAEARTVPGPVPPWFSVVLRVLRGKMLAEAIKGA